MKISFQIPLLLALSLVGSSLVADCKPPQPAAPKPPLPPLNTAKNVAWVEERLANFGLYKKDTSTPEPTNAANSTSDPFKANAEQQERVQVTVDASGQMLQQQQEAQIQEEDQASTPANDEPEAKAPEEATETTDDENDQVAASEQPEQAVPLHPALVEAIKTYQKKHGLYVTGELSDSLLAHMRPLDAWPASSLFSRVQNNSPKANLHFIEKDDPSLNAHDDHGWTPLLYAVLRGSPQVIAALLKAGANVDQGSTYGTTPLILAAVLNKSQHLQALLRASPRLDLVDHLGRFAEKVAFDEHKSGLSNIFFRHRKTMRQARLTKRIPFQVRMNVWDWQECYLAREGKVNVICKENPTCTEFENHEILLCDDKGEAYVPVLADLVHRMWGGHAIIYDGRNGDTASRLNCEEKDIMVLGIAFSE